MSSNIPVYVIQHNHYDPIWRRCWDRTFDYNGQRYRSYAEMEEMHINAWLELAKQGAPFSEGQAVVLRKYLERNPEKLETLRELVKTGLLELTGAGEIVPDTNLPAGETLLRNLVMGQRWFEETFETLPTIGWLEDAFGQSAQMPQIFRGCGISHVMKLSYKRVPGMYWKGLDGSVVCIAESPRTRHGGGGCKVPPCPECHGFGCPACEETGFARRGMPQDKQLLERFAEVHETGPCVIITVGDEETMPTPRLLKLLDEARAKPDAPNLKLGVYGDVAAHFADLVAKVDDPDIEVSDQVEANPVSTGCYITRIKIKQRFRAIEHALVAAEKWATVAWLHGADYPEETLRDAWRELIFVAFHDAITATHIDEAYLEIMDTLDRAQAGVQQVKEQALAELETGLPKTVAPHRRLVVYNAESWPRTDPVTCVVPRGQGWPRLSTQRGETIDVLTCDYVPEGYKITFAPPPVPPLGYLALRLGYAPAPRQRTSSVPGEIENHFFRIHVGTQGIESIVVVDDGKEFIDASTFFANELLLEEDDGHPWGTQQPPAFAERLGRDTTSVRIKYTDRASIITLTGHYQGRDPLVKRLEWKQTVTLYSDVSRIDCRTEIDWDTRSRRIKVAVPTVFPTSQAAYAIPYGALERGPYPPDLRTYPATDGDWPAINWIDVSDGVRGLGLLNRGTPSHKVEGGVIFLSLLRSPTRSWCLNEPEFYDCPDFDGARDVGHHVFEYSLVPHMGDWRGALMERRGREYNTPMQARLCQRPGQGKRGESHSFLALRAGDNVVVSAIKKADRIDGAVVRLAETNGQKARATLTLTGTQGPAVHTDFLERPGEPVGDNGVELSPFRIATVQLPRKG